MIRTKYGGSLLMKGLLILGMPFFSPITIGKAAESPPSFVATAYSVGANPTRIVVGNLTEDGAPHITTTNSTDNSVSVPVGKSSNATSSRQVSTENIQPQPSPVENGGTGNIQPQASPVESSGVGNVQPQPSPVENEDSGTGNVQPQPSPVESSGMKNVQPQPSPVENGGTGNVQPQASPVESSGVGNVQPQPSPVESNGADLAGAAISHNTIENMSMTFTDVDSALPWLSPFS